MTTPATKPSKFATSVAIVIDAVKELQKKGDSRQDILVAINNMLHDPELFTSKQRSNAVRELNKVLELKTSLGEVKKAIRTVNVANGEKAAHVDGLQGTAVLETVTPDIDEATGFNVTKPFQAAEVGDILTSYDVDYDKGLVNHYGKDAASGNPVIYICSAQGLFLSRAVVMPEETANLPNTESQQPSKENDTMRTVTETLKKVTETMRSADEQVTDNNTEVGAGSPGNVNTNTADDHARRITEVKAAFLSLGLTTELQYQVAIGNFISKYSVHAISWKMMQAFPKGENGILDTLVAFLEINKDAAENFKAFVTAELAKIALEKNKGNQDTRQAAQTLVGDIVGDLVKPVIPEPAKPEATFKERVMTTVRGNRETGFSSGVVAAATAVVGGALEMGMKGSATVGSAVGTLLGATGAYFAGNASEGAMESELGRYMLAGAIGVVAGGVGSRVGRIAQDTYNNPPAEIAGALETLPGAPSAAPAPVLTTGNTEALASFLGM